jgi:hypothetical protein
MGLIKQSGSSAGAQERPEFIAASDETVWAPCAGAYLTNGEALFRVAHAISDGPRRELLLELEDCATLEIVLCPACSLAESGLRSVTPAIAA